TPPTTTWTTARPSTSATARPTATTTSTRRRPTSRPTSPRSAPSRATATSTPTRTSRSRAKATTTPRSRSEPGQPHRCQRAPRPSRSREPAAAYTHSVSWLLAAAGGGDGCRVEDGESGVVEELAELVEVGLVHAVVEELGAHLGGHRVGQEAAGLAAVPGARPTEVGVDVIESGVEHDLVGVAAPLHVGTGRVHHPCECLVVGVEQP